MSNIYTFLTFYFNRQWNTELSSKVILTVFQKGKEFDNNSLK